MPINNISTVVSNRNCNSHNTLTMQLVQYNYLTIAQLPLITIPIKPKHRDFCFQFFPLVKNCNHLEIY